MIIFGGTKGIGYRLAAYYNKHRFKVSVAGRHPVCEGPSAGMNIIKADIVNEGDVEAVFKGHLKRWGQAPHAVINCAAIQGPIGNSWEISAKEFEKTLKINLLGSFVVAKASIQRMIPEGRGSIIMLSGGGSAFGRPHFNAYAASKTGLLRMVETMAEELKTAGYADIFINAVAPGAVKTGMTAEILKAGLRAGKRSFDEAKQVTDHGGTPEDQIIDLVNFLIDLPMNHGLTGRLIHVREDYRRWIKKHANKIPDEAGKIRRVPIQ